MNELKPDSVVENDFPRKCVRLLFANYRNYGTIKIQRDYLNIIHYIRSTHTHLQLFKKKIVSTID